ncbi:MAG TPA: hypothetical protein VME20_11990 [Acidimicrobiales bacterium]|nr:hypothetical protein [Acidimicrobiales bacterium]
MATFVAVVGTGRLLERLGQGRPGLALFGLDRFAGMLSAARHARGQLSDTMAGAPKTGCPVPDPRVVAKKFIFAERDRWFGPPPPV